MSVLVCNRKESRLEAITYSVELHKLLVELMQRNFGVKSLKDFTRTRFTCGKEKSKGQRLMRQKLKKLAVKVKSGEKEYIQVENMFKSWMGGFYKLLSRQQRNNLIKLYEGLFNKTITIVNKKMVIVNG